MNSEYFRIDLTFFIKNIENGIYDMTYFCIRISDEDVGFYSSSWCLKFNISENGCFC
jgi:hypothetical protein